MRPRSRFRRSHRFAAILAVLALLAGALLMPARAVAHFAGSAPPPLAASWEAAAFCGEHPSAGTDRHGKGDEALFCCLGGICGGQAVPAPASVQGLFQPVRFARDWTGPPSGEPVFPPMHFTSALKSRAPPVNLLSTETFI